MKESYLEEDIEVWVEKILKKENIKRWGHWEEITLRKEDNKKEDSEKV